MHHGHDGAGCRSGIAADVRQEAVMNLIKNGMLRLWRDESGMGTVEVVLIIVVLVGLVLIFQEQIKGLVETIFGKITEDTNSIIGG